MGINKNFVVRNGLEVANTLLYANDETNRIGINSGTPEHVLDVIGDAAIDGALYSPVSTGGTSGVSGQYLQSTGDKWRWETFPISRQAERITLVASQTRVPATGSFGTFILTEPALSSVFLDGVKLTEGDYVINAGGGSITLFAAAFGGEEIEVIAHGAAGVGAGNTGILGISIRKAGIDSGTAGRIQILDFVGLGVTLDGTSGLVTAYIDSGGLTDVLSDPSPQLGGYLDLNNKGIAGVGVITATEFHGLGSSITGISTLNIVNYGVGLGGAGNTNPSGVFGLLNDDSSVGIFTDTAAVGLGTTNPRFQTEIGPVGAAGTQLWVNGDARITGILTVGSSSITIDGINDEIRIGTSLTITSDGGAQYAGIITATGFDGDLVGQHKVFTAGVSNSDDYDVALFLNPTQGGHTFNRFDLGGKLQYNPSSGQLSNLGITSTRGLQATGISTFTDEVTFQGNIQLGNNDQAIFGAGNDLRIYFDGTNSYIQDQGTGGLNIEANPSVTIGRYGTTEEMASFRVGAGVSLFHNNSKKFETTPNGTYVTGISSAVSFYGSGIGLTATVDVADGTYGGSTASPQITVADGRITGITATLISGGGGVGGTEVIIEDNDSLVGTAGTINFGSGLSVSSSTAGVVTVTAATTEIINDTTPQLGGNLDLNSRTINGTGNINITGSSRFNGPATCTSDLDVSGTATFNVTQFNQNAAFANDKVLNFGGSSNGRILYVSGTNSFDVRVPGGSEDLKLGAGTNVRITNENGLTDRAVFNATGLNVTGVVTATAFYGDGSNLTGLATALSELSNDVGFVTFTNVSQLNNDAGFITNVVSGVLTATRFDGDGSGLTNLPAATIIPVADESSDTTCFPIFTTAATGNLELKSGSNLNFNSSNGTLTATKFSGDGSSLTGLATALSEFTNDVGFVTFTNVSQLNNDAGFITNVVSGVLTATSFDGDVTGDATGLSGSPSITVTDITASGNVSIAGTLTYEDVTNIDSVGLITARSGIEFGVSGVGGTITATGQAEFAGVVTATSFSGSGANLTSLNASELDSGTIPDDRFPSVLPAVSGANLTDLNASNLTSGTIPDARFPSVLPAVSGANLTGLTADDVGALAGVSIREEGSLVGTAGSVGNINFVSVNLSATASGIGATITLTDYPTFTGINATGVITATSFSGDGSGLTRTGYFDNNQTNSGIHTTAAHVGLGTTNPRTPLQVEEVYGVYTDYGSFSATAGVTTVSDASWVIATDDFKTAEYTLYFQHSSGIQSQKVLVMNDGTAAYAQEYAIMYNNDLLVSVGASVNSGTCELLWTPEPGVSGIVTYRVVRETML